MRSLINGSSSSGVAAIVAQQFKLAEQIAGHGLLPIIEPEISIKSPNESGAEDLLLAELQRALDALPSTREVALKLTLPTRPGLYDAFADHPRVVRVPRPLGWILQGRGVPTPCEQFRHDRQFFPRPVGRPARGHVAGSLRRRPRRRCRPDLPGLCRKIRAVA